MREIEVVLHLPENLVEEANRLGILSSSHIEQLLRADILAQLAAMADDADIQAEIAAINTEFEITELDGLEQE